MDSSLLYHLRFMALLFLLLILVFPVPMTPLLCHNEESLALLQFKQSFVIDKSASSDAYAYPKTISWNQQGENQDCCLWDGVECDQHTGRVISLGLSSSYLYGSINSSSSLFHLGHLESLDLSDNHFNSSQIPSGFESFPRLAYLNLSYSVFYGKIPLEIAGLRRLRSLDLTGNLDASEARMLEFTSPDLMRLVQNLTHIEKLHLDNIDLSAAIPGKIANLSSLSSLSLYNCGLLGTFPMGIFELPNLKYLDVGMNEELVGHLPEFHWGSSPLKFLLLQRTKFSGGLPPSIGNLHSLTGLDIHDCNFSGPIPSSLGNLSEITFLRLRANNFFGQIPSSLANLTQLTSFSISGNDNFSCGSLSWLEKQTDFLDLIFQNCNITGEIPHFLKNFTQLERLQLNSNHLGGQIPHWLTNLTQLAVLGLGSNEFHGPFPHQISECANLEVVNLAENHLSGIVNLNPFFNLQSIEAFDISENDFTLLHVITNANATLRKWQLLGLGSCNLREFPDFLRYQDKLEYLDLTGNKIQGQIPSWLWSIGRETLEVIQLGSNFLTGFEKPALVSRLRNLKILWLPGNKIQGPVPKPPPSIHVCSFSNNSFSGEISSTFCNLPYLDALDLSFNNLSGMLPQCLFANNLRFLNLEQNFFSGIIPETLTNGSKLRMINLGYNALQGKLPRSLVKHTMLEFLNLGDNQISDGFPFWLGALHNLQVFILRSNKFFGSVGSPASGFEFSMLRIIDISHNGFTGILPSEYFQKWNGMKISYVDHFSYMAVSISSFRSRTKTTYYNSKTTYYKYQLTLVNKGVSLHYPELANDFTAVDLSSNKFEGEIPESIATLKNLRLLNLSDNRLSGHIPLAIENLTKLESLDFSRNMLSGKIPHELSQLTFLQIFNVSCNQLIGPIPQGKQFDTFENNSYKDNLGLCGKPLSKLCGNAGESPPSPSTGEDDQGSGGSSAYVLWMIVAIGYASGVAVGVVAGLRFTTSKHEWFVETFGRRQQKRRRLRTRGQRV